MPVRAFLDSDLSRYYHNKTEKKVSMPVRAFLDSDGVEVPPQELPGRVSMPVRAFLDSDIVNQIQLKKKESFNARQGIS